MPRFVRLITAFAVALLAVSCVESSRGLLEVNTAVDSVVAVTGNAQSAFVGAAVTTPPTVVVKDANGFRIPGIRVRFVPGTGSGSVTDGDQVTDSGGRATVGAWTVGPDSGVDTLYALVVGAPTARQSRIAFTATVVDPCGLTVPYTIGTTFSDSLTGTGCVTFAGDLAKPLRFSVTAQSAIRFTASSTAFAAAVDLTRASGVPVALSDTPPAVGAGTIYAIVPAGDYRVFPGALTNNARGRFTLTSAFESPANGCITNLFLARNVVAPGVIGSVDCPINYNVSTVYNGESFSDYYGLFVNTNETVTVRASSTNFDTVLLVLPAERNSLITVNDNITSATSTNSAVAFNPQANGLQGGLYYFVVTGKSSTLAGSYTISVDP